MLYRKKFSYSIVILRYTNKAMGVTKSALFTDAQNSLAVMAKALGHPARIAIIDYLLRHQTCICNDLVEELPLSQSTITQHLRELKAVGLIKGEIEGPKVNYCIDATAWQQASTLFGTLFGRYPAQNNCC